MTRSAVVAIALALAVSFVCAADAQDLAAGTPALAVPVEAQLVVTDAGKPQMSGGGILNPINIIPLPVKPGPSVTQRYEVDIAVPIFGLPLRGHASVHTETHTTVIVIVPVTRAGGQAEDIVLHGPAGDATVSLAIALPTHANAPPDLSEATIRVRSTGGTGMFEGIRIIGELKSLFRPTGTLYLSYPTQEAALAAVQRGLEENSSATETQRQQYLADARQAVAHAVVTTFPSVAGAPGAAGARTSAPSRAEVRHVVTYNGERAEIALRIVVPAGSPHQVVKVVAVGADGSARTILDETHSPGDVITTGASGTVPLIVQVYVAGVMVEQVPATGM